MSAGGWTGERRWIAVLVVAVLLVLVATIGVPLGPVRVVAGILATFFAPGYALILAIRPRQLAAIGRIMLSVPLSLAVAIGCGVALNLSPFGVYPGTLASATALVTLILFLVAAWPRRRELRALLSPARRRGGTGPATLARPPRPGLTVLVLGVALVALLAWAGVGLVLGSREQPAHYTELFVLGAGPDGAGAAVVRLGVRNREGGERRYALRVSRGANPDNPAAGTPVPSPGGSNTFVVERDLTIADNAEEALDIRLNLACGDVVEAQLWLADNGPPAAPYRTVRIRPDCAGAAGTPTP